MFCKHLFATHRLMILDMIVHSTYDRDSVKIYTTQHSVTDRLCPASSLNNVHHQRNTKEISIYIANLEDNWSPATDAHICFDTFDCHLPTTCCTVNTNRMLSCCLGLLLGTEAPAVMPNRVDFPVFSFLSCRLAFQCCELLGSRPREKKLLFQNFQHW